MKSEEKASQFYNSNGWSHDDKGNTLDANKWEDLRDCSKEYLANCRSRVNKYIPKSGDLFFDLGSGPIQYPEYLEHSSNFKERHCLDLSKDALDIAKSKAKNIKIFHGSFLKFLLKIVLMTVQYHSMSFIIWIKRINLKQSLN